MIVFYLLLWGFQILHFLTKDLQSFAAVLHVQLRILRPDFRLPAVKAEARRQLDSSERHQEDERDLKFHGLCCGEIGAPRPTTFAAY